MKIDTNMIGNYSPHINRSVNADVKVREARADENLKPLQTEKVNNLSKAEKDFFVNMYPENKSEIKDYHFYKRNGEKSGVQIGSLFDQRG